MTNISELYLTTQDGTQIAINHHKTGHDAVLIIAHGWFMTKDSKCFSEIANAFSENFDVIVLDFRGHGQSSGVYTFTTKEPQDMKAVVNYAKTQYKKVYLMGFSLGGALVLIHGALEKDVDKIVAVSAPFCFRKIQNQIWKKEAWLQTLKKFEFKRWISVRPSPIVRKKISAGDVVNKIEVPTLFIAGEFDPTVHSWHTKCLYKKAKCEKHFELFKKCYHAEDIFFQEQEKFITICTNWLFSEKFQAAEKSICS